MTVTLHDVAARTGLSIATVSRAINGLPVSAKAKAQVAQAVTALGYVPNEAARTLRNDKSVTIGVIFFDLRNPLALELIDTISATIEGAGYALLIASARGDQTRYDLLMRRFLERRVDGLFCIAPRGASETLARYRAANLPVIALFDRADEFEDLPLLVPSFQDAARTLRDHLTELGHSHAAIVRPDRASPALSAVGATLRKGGLQVDDFAVSAAGGLRDVLASILAPERRTTAIVAAHAQVRGLLSACETTGVPVPGRLSIAGISEIGGAASDQRQGVSAVTVEPEFLGRAAGTAMLDWLGGKEPPKLTRVQGATFFARRTTGPAAQFDAS
jgi:LacI family transcriptional regulator